MFWYCFSQWINPSQEFANRLPSVQCLFKVSKIHLSILPMSHLHIYLKLSVTKYFAKLPMNLWIFTKTFISDLMLLSSVDKGSKIRIKSRIGIVSNVWEPYVHYLTLLNIWPFKIRYICIRLNSIFNTNLWVYRQCYNSCISGRYLMLGSNLQFVIEEAVHLATRRFIC